MSADQLPFTETLVREKLAKDPGNWEIRRELAHGLYDKQAYGDAADAVWEAEQIPSTDLDLAFAIRVLAKARPRRAIRLLTAVLELNRGKGVQNMGMANALLHHGMILQAARFYGAALEADPALANPDLEHFLLWSDDECTLWGIFEKHRPKLGDLPWMLRDPKEALRLTSRISVHTTPIKVPDLPAVAGEDLKHDLYQQEAKKNGKITPPPAVTIPIDRVAPKDRLYDSKYGATVEEKPASAPTEQQANKPAPIPIPITLKPDEAAVPPTPNAPAPLSGSPTRTLLPSGAPPASPTRPRLITPPIKTSEPEDA